MKSSSIGPRRPLARNLKVYAIDTKDLKAVLKSVFAAEVARSVTPHLDKVVARLDKVASGLDKVALRLDKVEKLVHDRHIKLDGIEKFIICSAIVTPSLSFFVALAIVFFNNR